MVTIDPVGQPDPKIPSIGASNSAGALQATEYLRLATIVSLSWLQVEQRARLLPVGGCPGRGYRFGG
jgi:hypothetical protein